MQVGLEHLVSTLGADVCLKPKIMMALIEVRCRGCTS